eukprot:3004679-Pyramimonas_sp.AAC.1
MRGNTQAAEATLAMVPCERAKMRLVLTKIGLDSVRLNRIKSVCDTRRARRAWDKSGHTVMSYTALPGKFNEEVECDFVFYKQE